MCLEAGVNLVDTADVYSDGLSEEIVGEALRAGATRRARHQGARSHGRGPNDGGLSRHHLIAACEASLRRLGTDRIDLYQVHEWDGLTPLEETLEALDASSGRQGALRRLLELLGLAPDEGARGSPTGAACRASSASRSTTRCRRARPSTSWCRSRSTRGWASSSGARSPAACCPASTAAARAARGPRSSPSWGEPPVHDEDKLYDIVDALVAVAEARGVSAAQVALAWLLGRPGVTSVIVGARTEEQLADNLPPPS